MGQMNSISLPAPIERIFVDTELRDTWLEKERIRQSRLAHTGIAQQNEQEMEEGTETMLQSGFYYDPTQTERVEEEFNLAAQEQLKQQQQQQTHPHATHPHTSASVQASSSSTSSSAPSSSPPPPPSRRRLRLPGPLLSRIFQYLNLNDLLHASRSSRLYHSIGQCCESFTCQMVLQMKNEKEMKRVIRSTILSLIQTVKLTIGSKEKTNIAVDSSSSSSSSHVSLPVVDHSIDIHPPCDSVSPPVVAPSSSFESNHHEDGEDGSYRLVPLDAIEPVLLDVATTTTTATTSLSDTETGATAIDDAIVESQPPSGDGVESSTALTSSSSRTKDGIVFEECLDSLSLLAHLRELIIVIPSDMIVDPDSVVDAFTCLVRVRSICIELVDDPHADASSLASSSLSLLSSLLAGVAQMAGIESIEFRLPASCVGADHQRAIDTFRQTRLETSQTIKRIEIATAQTVETLAH